MANGKTLGDYYMLSPPSMVLPYVLGWTADSFVGLTLILLIYFCIKY